MSETNGVEGALAEFDAIRREIELRIGLQQQVFTVHLTSAGAVFSLALSNSSLQPVVLVLPVTTYLFAGHYLTLHLTIRNAAGYIRNVLSARVPGGLGWEKAFDQQRTPSSQPVVKPFYLTFPGVSLVATLFGLNYARSVLTELDALTTVRGAALASWLVVCVLVTFASYLVTKNFSRDPPEDRSAEGAEESDADS